MALVRSYDHGRLLIDAAIARSDLSSDRTSSAGVEAKAERLPCGPDDTGALNPEAAGVFDQSARRNPCHPGPERGMWWRSAKLILADRTESSATRRQTKRATPDEGNRHLALWL